MKNASTRLFLIRHGDTLDEETERVFKGSLDMPLSEKGRARIEKAGIFLSRFHFDHIYTSALSRCMETGSIIARPHNLEIRTSVDLNELRFGSWEGMTFREIHAEYPEEFQLWLANPEVHAPPLGETLTQAEKRATRGLREIITRHRGSNIGVVSHGGTLRIILCSLLGLQMSRLFSLGQDYGGVSIVDLYSDDHAVLQLLNFTFYAGDTF